MEAHASSEFKAQRHNIEHTSPEVLSSNAVKTPSLNHTLLAIHCNNRVPVNSSQPKIV